MAKIKELEGHKGFYTFRCPGCKSLHSFNTNPEWGNKIWEFNGSFDKPTFRPSLLNTYKANPEALEQYKEWRNERTCHLYVTDGKIEYQPDCFHELAGQTIELPEYE